MVAELLPSKCSEACGIIQSIDWGPPPPADYKDKIVSFFHDHLKDPKSAKYDVMEPRRDIIQKGFASPT